MKEYTHKQRIEHLGVSTVAYWERVEAEARMLACRQDPKRVRAEKRSVDAYVYKSSTHVEEDKRLATDDEVRRFFSHMGGYDDTPSIGHNSRRRDKIPSQGLD